ncbi:MAG: hypothetical protein GY759_07810 [Chloroflexi bacterium]|nr:hypothetical protein [Chloroflexota bacterium]
MLPVLVTTPLPPESGIPNDLPLSLWANLPLLVCGAFFLFIIIGTLLIIRKNRSMAQERALFEQTNHTAKDA